MWVLQQEIHISWGLHCNDIKNHHSSCQFTTTMQLL